MISKFYYCISGWTCPIWVEFGKTNLAPGTLVKTERWVETFFDVLHKFQNGL